MSANMKQIENYKVNEDKTLKKAIKICGNFYGLDCKITSAFKQKDTNIWIVTGIEGYSEHNDWTINADVYDDDEYKTVQHLLKNIQKELKDELDWEDETLESFITSIFRKELSEVRTHEEKYEVYSKLHNTDSERIGNEKFENLYWADVSATRMYAIRLTMATWLLGLGKTQKEVENYLQQFYSFVVRL